jgi:hypothetical protein
MNYIASYFPNKISLSFINLLIIKEIKEIMWSFSKESSEIPCSYLNFFMMKSGLVRINIFRVISNYFFQGMYTNFSLYPAMNYSTSYAYNSSAFQPDTYDYYGDNPISYDTSCYWTQNGSVDGPLGDVIYLIFF